MRKLAICYPGEMAAVYTSAAHSLVSLEKPRDCETRWFRGRGWCQARRRNHAAEQALDWNADLIACLDWDQVYEPDLLIRLLGRYDEGYPVIAAMVPMRGYVEGTDTRPFQRIAWKIQDGAFKSIDPADGDVQQCEFPTSAVILFSADVYRRLSKPWYAFTYKPETWEIERGEDATFALRVTRELGLRAWVDTTIRVKHIHAFEIDETYPERFADWSARGQGDPGICRYPKDE